MLNQNYRRTFCAPCKKYGNWIKAAQKRTAKGFYEGIVESSILLKEMYMESVQIKPEIKKALMASGLCSGCSMSLYDTDLIEDYLFLESSLKGWLSDRSETDVTKILLLFGEALDEAKGDIHKAGTILEEKFDKYNIKI